MNPNMRLQFDRQILQEMNEGVILLDAQGDVLAHNHAADLWMQEGESVRIALKRLVEGEKRSGSPSPRRFELCIGAFNQPKKWANAWLCKNGPDDFTVFIASHPTNTAPSAAAVTHTDAGGPSSAMLLGQGLRAQMAEFRSLLSTAKGDPARELATLSAKCEDIDQLLQTISDLSLLQRDNVFCDERLDLAEQLHHLIPSLAAHPGVHYFFSPQPGPQGMVYGSAAWLNQALRVLLEGLGSSAPSTSYIDIRLRQLGDFVVITGHVVAGTGSFPAATAVAHDEAPASSNAASNSPRSRLVNELICRRIIELHTGQHKLEYMPNPGNSEALERQVESFTLTLATGLPEHERSRASCAECRYTLQAQAYASDMALLLSPKNHTTTGVHHHDQSSHR